MAGLLGGDRVVRARRRRGPPSSDQDEYGGCRGRPWPPGRTAPDRARAGRRVDRRSSSVWRAGGSCRTAGRGPAGTSRSATARSAALAKRSSGSLASALSTMSRSRCGTCSPAAGPPRGRGRARPGSGCRGRTDGVRRGTRRGPRRGRRCRWPPWQAAPRPARVRCSTAYR